MLVVGRISAAYGIKGWVKVRSFFESEMDLKRYPLFFRRGESAWRPIEMDALKVQGKGLVAHFVGCDDRNAADDMRGVELAVASSCLPALEDDDFYWQELIGMAVFTATGEALGEVESMLETGANDVLVVRASEGKERLIPFVLETYVTEVNRESRQITVDWDPEF